MKEKIKKFFKILGPGFITGASDDDPSGIATFSSSGAKFGFSQLWTPLFTFPLMLAVQEMAGRIGLVTGRGLAGVIRKNFSKKILYFCVSILIFANTINIGVNIGAMASAMKMLLPLPFIFWAILITVLLIVLQILFSYRVYSRVLYLLALSLLT